MRRPLLPAARDRPGHVRQLHERRDTAARSPPFGIAQIGKSFRNEITPGTSCSGPASSSRWRWSSSSRPTSATLVRVLVRERFQWYLDHGMPEDLLRLVRTRQTSCSHYSWGTSDVEFLFPWGWDELEGIANRGNYDLTQHAAALGPEARVVRPGRERALPAARDRARRRRHPDGLGVPDRRL